MLVRRILSRFQDGGARLRLSHILGLIPMVCLVIPAFSAAASAKETPSIESAFVSTTAKIATTSDGANVPVEWKYKNSTDLPLFVEKVDESCGCLSGQVKLDNPDGVKPGESGVIRASFTASGYRGIVRKSLHVRFVGYDKPVELIVEATIPSSVEISNKEPSWEIGDEIKTQSIDVTSGTGEDFNITSLQGVPESLFTITEETITPKRHYRIDITPVSLTTPSIQCLQIRTDSKDVRDQVIGVFLQVRSSGTHPPRGPSQTITTP